MTPEQGHASLELSKKLKELGVLQKSYFVWGQDHPGNPGSKFRSMHWRTDQGAEWGDIAAFSVAELGVALGRNVNDVSWHVQGWREWIEIGRERFHKKEADARASRLAFLIKNKIISVQEVNERLRRAV